MFVYGPGGTGKSVFSVCPVRHHGQLFDHCRDGRADGIPKYDRHSTELAALAGSRLVTASETDESRRSWDESRVKTLTGSDRISARFMRRKFV